MTEQQAFLARIREQPDDDLSRLVYCDFLEERDGPGDAERAAFIRTQVEITKGPPKGKDDESLGESLAILAEWKRKQDDLAAAELIQFDRVRDALGREIDPWWRLAANSSNCYRCAQHQLGRGFPIQAIFRRGFVDEVVCDEAMWMGRGNCRMCSGRGWYPTGTALGGPVQEKCEVCDGCRGQPPIGPPAVASQPITKVKLPRRHPQHNAHDSWMWSNVPAYEPGVPHRDCRVDGELVELMRLDRRKLYESLTWVSFADLETAYDALWSAVVLWAIRWNETAREVATVAGGGSGGMDE